MTRSNYTPAFKAKIVLEVLREEREHCSGEQSEPQHGPQLEA